MERIKLNPELEISRLVYGLWRIKDDPDHSPAHVVKKIHACLEQGITTLDQADIYGDYGAEAVLGDALRSETGLRQKVEIVTKCDIVAPIGRFSHARVKHYDTSRAHIEAQVDASLKNMGIDEIDLLLIHRPDPLMDHKETGAALDDLVKSGKVRAVGVSNFMSYDWSLLQSGMTTPLATNQIELSVIHHEPLTDGAVAHLQKNNISPMAWSPLAGGALFSEEHRKLYNVLKKMGEPLGVSADAIAIAWLLRHPAKIVPVLGTNNLERIHKISDALKPELSREDWFEIYEAALGREVL